MAAPNHVVDHQLAAEESAAFPNAGHDPSISPDHDPTRLLVEMLAGTALGMPMAAPNQVDQPQMAAAAASVSATAGHCPGVAPDGNDDDPTLALTKALATATLGTAAAVATAAAPGVSESPPAIQANQSTPAAAKPARGRAERQARRRLRPRLLRVPTDYLRAGQESRDRSRRRELVRRCVGRLFSVHEDRASERGISAMMARLTTALESASGAKEGDAAVSAAAPSPEHAGLAELLEKMALSKKH